MKLKIDRQRLNEWVKNTQDCEVSVGDKLHIIKMEGEPQYAGKEGIVECIDSIGQIHGTWGGCALIPGKDEYACVQ